MNENPGSTDEIPVCAAPDPHPHAADFQPPPGACDCHAHVFPDDPRYSLVLPRTYSPSLAELPAYLHLLSVLGLARGVIVQPSVYGTDNRPTLDAVAAAPAQLRAVVVVDDDVSVSDLEVMQQGGARGTRANLLFATSAVLTHIERLAATLAELGWHLQMLIDVSEFEDFYAWARRLPVPLVIDHFGHMPTHKGINHPGFQALLRLVAEGNVWVKLSGAYRVTGLAAPPYSDVDVFAEALIRANPERMVWASDWPHPHFPGAMPNDGELLQPLQQWAGNASTLKQILVTNPQTLYGFEPLDT